MHIFYKEDLSQQTVTLSEEESKHCVKVLRMVEGDVVTLTDGTGKQVTAKITAAHAKKCVVEVIEEITHQPNKKYYLHLLVAPTKNAERTEWFVEKATELGIDEITFIETTNSERTKINMERCLKVAISAMKQSKQWYLPKINNLVLFDKLPQTDTLATLKYIAWCRANTEHTLVKMLSNKTPFEQTHIQIFIGPEGDFTEQEITKAQQYGYVPISLGNTILRTETAAVYVCAAIRAVLGE